MSKHTPGPWRYMAGTHSHYDSEGKAIARVYGPRGIDCSRRDANARLIAAAPRMLELLKRLLPIAEDAAESLGRFCSDEGWAQEDMDRMDNVDGMLPLMRAAIKAAEGEQA